LLHRGSQRTTKNHRGIEFLYYKLLRQPDVSKKQKNEKFRLIEYESKEKNLSPNEGINPE
jgi:hypothetical protein